MTGNGSNPNATAYAYLDEYCSKERQRDFAVLLEGPWGAGKTYFIKEFLKERPHLYVSLYGLTDVRQIDDEFFRLLHPVLSSKGMRLVGAAAKAVLRGTLKLDWDGDGKEDGSLNVGLPGIDLKAGLADPGERLLVFDDLERCNMPVGVVLGYINAFVEHDGLKVIILANESEILKKKKQKYGEMKEKLIGQTFRISCTAADAFDTFLDGISNTNVRHFISGQRELVLAIHQQSGTNNLRILKQAMWDFERFAQHLTDVQRAKADSVQQLMSVLLALSIEHRRGQLQDRRDMLLLAEPVARIMQRQRDGKNSVADDIADRYPQIDFGDTIVPPELLADAVLDARSEKADVQAALANSKHFAPSEARPLWVQAWDYYSATDDEGAEVSLAFKAAFDAREFAEAGVIIQVFGILLRYAKRGFLPISSSQAVELCKDYVDDLVKSGRVPAKEGWVEEPMRSYGHYGFMEIGTEEFREVVEHLKQAVLAADRARYPERAKTLMDSLDSGSDDFVLDLCPNNVRAPRYQYVPILTGIAPKDFVSRFLQLTPALQYKVTGALFERYRSGRLVQVLPDEVPWIKEVRGLLLNATNAVGPFSKDRLEGLIEEHIDSVLTE